MSFTLSFPGTQDAEPYTGLIEEHEVYEQVCEEVRKSITDMGSDGYNPDEFVPDNYDPEKDEDGEVWNDAVTAAIEHEVTMRAPQIFKDLWLRYPSDASGVHDLGPERDAKLPDGVTIRLTEVSP